MIWIFSHAALAVSLFALAMAVGAAAPRTVAGRVLDPFGQVVAGAAVSLAVDGAPPQWVATDETGWFSFEAGEFSRAEISVARDGFTPASISLGQTEPADALEIVLSVASLAETVVVTATRGRGLRVADSAASVTTIDDRSILAGGERSLDDVLRSRVPGFSLFRRTSGRVANPTTQGVSLRGTGGSGASRTAVVDDGIPATDPFGGWIYWSRLPRARIRSIEVVRGSASDTYGSNAIGGVIGVESRAIAPRTLLANTSFGNLGNADVSFWASHAGDANGAGRGGWGTSLALDAATFDGYIPVAEAERGPVDEEAGGRSRSIEAVIERRFSERGFFTSAPRLFLRGQIFGERRQNGTTLQRNSTASRLLVLGGEAGDRHGDAWNFRLYTGTQGYDQSFTSIQPDRAAELLARLQRVPARQKGLSLVWSRGFAGSLLATAGVEARQVRGVSDEIIYQGGSPTTSTVAGGVQQTVGLFGNAEFLAWEKLRITAGLRFETWHNRDAFSGSRPLRLPGPTPATPLPDRRADAVSPRVAAVFTPRERLSFRAAIGRGFRAPTLNELYRDFRVGNVLTRGNPDLDAERATNGEVGALWTSVDGRVALRATGFVTTIDDPVSNVTLSITPALITRQRRNLGQSRSQGLEAEAEVRPAPEWFFAVSYLLADTTVRKFPADPSLVGLRVPQVPRHAASLEARYMSPRFINASLVARYLSDALDDDRNLLRLGAFWVVDFYVERPITGWVDLFLSAENLLDREYATGRTPVTTVGAPRTVRFGLNVRFAQR